MHTHHFRLTNSTLINLMRIFAILLVLTSILLLFIGCGSAQDSSSKDSNDSDWINLFDGSDLSGYRIFAFPDANSDRWTAEDGVLSLAARAEGSKSKLDLIITTESIGDFEFSFEWKMSPGGNGGIFYMVKDDPQYTKPWHTGLEMQLLDNGGHVEGKIKTHRSGDLYDLIESNKDTTLPAGEWNQSRIVRRGNEVEQWMNGNLAVSFTIGSSEWNALISKSKYAEWPEYGKVDQGHLILQDHGDQISFRNLKLKEL
jgi:hypothetical protein